MSELGRPRVKRWIGVAAGDPAHILLGLSLWSGAALTAGLWLLLLRPAAALGFLAVAGAMPVAVVVVR